MKSPKAPPPINVDQTAAKIADANLKAGQTTQSLSTIGQDNPLASLDYTTTIDPITGLPKYQANTSFSPEQMALLGLKEGNQYGMGGTAYDMIQNLFGQYTQDPNLVGGANSLTNQALDSMMPAWERFDAPARAQLDTQLRNQGIMPDENDPQHSAYQQQMDKLIQQQDLNRGQWMAGFQPQAFDEVTRQYGIPAQLAGTFMGMANPDALNNTFLNTPGANVAAPDIAGLTEANYQGQMNAYLAKVQAQNNMMNGIMKGVGGVASLPMGGGTSLGGMAIGSLFA